MKPGQFCTINNTVYRAKKRTCGCRGCALDSFFMCPCIVDSRNGNRKINCSLDDIIFVKV